MSMMKEFLMDIEELAWEAIELGFQTDEEIYAYVSMTDSRVSLDTIRTITSEMFAFGLDDREEIVYQ